MGNCLPLPQNALPVGARLRKEWIPFSWLETKSPDVVIYLISLLLSIPDMASPSAGLVLVGVQTEGIRIIRLGGIIVF